MSRSGAVVPVSAGTTAGAVWRESISRLFGATSTGGRSAGVIRVERLDVVRGDDLGLDDGLLGVDGHLGALRLRHQRREQEGGPVLGEEPDRADVVVLVLADVVEPDGIDA